MNILISLALAFSLLGSTTVERHKDTVVMDGDVIMGNKLPEWGTVCGDAEVRGGPDAGIYGVLYIIPDGTSVRLRDQSKPTGEWVMIEPAQWIPITALCMFQ